ncbi:MAG: FHA domain-containing protein [Anaerolineales bacterium]|nr:FHA domain-containing protein [Anaerolineales bacterium]
MNLREIEARLQALVEVDLLKALPGRRVEDILFQKVAAAIQQGSEDSLAPDVYTFTFNSKIAESWRDPRLLAALTNSIVAVAQEAGFQFTISPIINVADDEAIPINDVEIKTSYRIDAMAETNSTPLNTGALPADETLPENSFLIIEGVKFFPLTLTVINIGRKLENQLVIDDPRVSRAHAQIRAIKGRFVIFDLNSTGGTFVNGQRSSQTVLYPGDVISLAGVALIFGQDNQPTRTDLKETTPFRVASERPTASFTKNTDRFNKDK